MLAILYAALMAFAAVGFVVAIFGAMNDSNNNYPGPLLVAAVVAGAVALWLAQ